MRHIVLTSSLPFKLTSELIGQQTNIKHMEYSLLNSSKKQALENNSTMGSI